MLCKECPAYGIDSLGFHGCLVRNSMSTLSPTKDGCRRRKETIHQQIIETKRNEPRAKSYVWRNEL